jgi:tetratricopeptide (TPR) repeat protein
MSGDLLGGRRVSPIPSGRLLAIPVALLLQYAAPVAAQTQRDPAAAEALYRSARELLKNDDWAGACPKFRASYKLDPVASTLLNIARCHEQEGKLSRAWADYKAALVLNQETPGAERQKVLEDIARQALASIEPRLPKLRLIMRGDPPVGLKLSRDGQPIPAEMLGELVPADPGAQEIVAEAPGFRTQRITISLEEGKTQDVEISLVPAPRDGVRGSARTPDADRPSGEGSASVPTWAWISGAAGVLLVGAGAAFRLDGAAAERRLDKNCPNRVCDPAGSYDPDPDNARKNRDFALFVGFGAAGVAALGAATAGILLAQPGPSTQSASSSPLRVAVTLPSHVSLRLAF